MGLRFIIIAVIIAAIGLSIAGFFAYQKSIISDFEAVIVLKDKEIRVLTEQIAGLEQDNLKLTVSNQSLVAEIERKAADTKEAYEEIAILRESDARSTERLAEVERKLNDQQRLKRIESIRLSRKASLLLRIMDKNIKCYVENFARVGEGKCIAGKFRPNKVEEPISIPEEVQ